MELGSDITDVQIGERIAMYTPYGAFQEYVPVDRYGYGFARVPDNLSNEAASICEMFDGAFRGTIAPAEVQPGERVLIVGAGPMGLTAASAAAACGAKVCVMDFHENRLRKAREMGASFTYDRSRMSAKEIVCLLYTSRCV